MDWSQIYKSDDLKIRYQYQIRIIKIHQTPINSLQLIMKQLTVEEKKKIKVLQKIYQGVVSMLKKDSIDKYEKRKAQYRLKNNIPLDEITIKQKQNNPQQQTAKLIQKLPNERFQKSQENTTKPNNQNKEASYHQTKSNLEETTNSQNQVQIKSSPQTNTQKPYQEPIRPIKNAIDVKNQTIQQYKEIKLVPCPAGCGRSFNPESLIKHSKNCKKVFGTEVVPVDFAKKREVQGMQNVKKSQQPVAPKKKSSVNSSQSLQAKIRQARGQKLTAQEQNILEQSDDRVGCKICGRKFNAERIEKHELVCSKSKK